MEIGFIERQGGNDVIILNDGITRNLKVIPHRPESVRDVRRRRIKAIRS